MKKTVYLFTIIILVFALSGCYMEEDSSNYIEKAKLTKEEEKIAELLGDISEYEIFDFKIDSEIKTIQTNLNELKNGKWEFVSGDLSQFKDKSGRIAFSFGNVGEGLRIATQSKSTSGYSSYNTEYMEELNREDVFMSSSALKKREEIIYEKEIPLFIQVLSSKDTVKAFGMDSFFTPEVYEEDDYEHVYAITIMFSKKTMDELTEDKDK